MPGTAPATGTRGHSCAKPWGLRGLILLGCGAGVWALLLLAAGGRELADFNRRQPWILLLNTCAVVALGVLLTRKLWQLYRDFQNHVPGSRLTARTVGMFGTLVVVPLLIVYLFALEFLNYGIDSWFRVEFKHGLNDALVLSRSALELRLREQARRTEEFARHHRQCQRAGPGGAARCRAARGAGRRCHRLRQRRRGAGIERRGRHARALAAARRASCCRSPPATVTSASRPRSTAARRS